MGTQGNAVGRDQACPEGARAWGRDLGQCWEQTWGDLSRLRQVSPRTKGDVEERTRVAGGNWRTRGSGCCPSRLLHTQVGGGRGEGIEKFLSGEGGGPQRPQCAEGGRMWESQR